MYANKVSVIVPIYNTDKYLKSCIDSILNQTLEEIEVILINDGSSDDSDVICKEYAKKDKRILYREKKNGGQSTARNLALGMASGEFVAFVDSDDYINPNMLEFLYEQSNKYSADIVGSKRNDRVVNMGDKLISDVKIYETDILKHYLEIGDVSCCTKIYKRVLFEEISFEENVTAEDIKISYLLFKKCERYVYSENIFYNVNRSGGSTTRSTLKIRDFNAITSSEFIKSDYNDDIVNIRYFENVFNILNKGVIYGFDNKDTEFLYFDSLSKWKRTLRTNLVKIVKSTFIITNNKIQIIAICFSFSLFKSLKKIQTKDRK